MEKSFCNLYDVLQSRTIFFARELFFEPEDQPECEKKYYFMLVAMSYLFFYSIPEHAFGKPHVTDTHKILSRRTQWRKFYFSLRDFRRWSRKALACSKRQEKSFYGLKERKKKIYSWPPAGSFGRKLGCQKKIPRVGGLSTSAGIVFWSKSDGSPWKIFLLFLLSSAFLFDYTPRIQTSKVEDLKTLLLHFRMAFWNLRESFLKGGQ